MLLSAVFALALCSCKSAGNYAALQKDLSKFIKGKDAEIGVAVIIDGVDTVEVNGRRIFPMLSVYKFPIALAAGERCRKDFYSLEKPVYFGKEDLHPGTYSPMTEKILASSALATDSISLPLKELLTSMLQNSDNNASDIVLKFAGGAQSVEGYLNRLKIAGISVRNSEDEMHTDPSLCQSNSATPLAMAALFDKFDREMNDSISMQIKLIMENCTTGTERLAKPLKDSGATIGHKTGTGFMLPDGRIMAVNDAGYVHLPAGRRYSIAVFVENSGYDMAQTEDLIASISRIVVKNLTRK